MPRKKRNKRTEANFKKTGIFSQIKLGESYTSFILGLVVIVVSLILVVSFIKNSNSKQTSSTSTFENISEQDKNQSLVLPTTYTVKSGDSLWSIAESFYKSGYNWVAIAKANNLGNPGLIHVGNKLSIPNTQPIVVKQIQNQQNKETVNLNTISVSGDTYLAVKGDNLWDIAVRTYGDGFKWVEIAKANNLVNPSLIHSGNVFKIPR